MAGYNPSCSDCQTCMTCRGNGFVEEPVAYDAPGGSNYYRKERKTCSRCDGVGGKACREHR